MEILIVIGFLGLWCSAVLWLFLCYRLFKSLEKDHPEKFIAIGRTNLGANNSISTNIRLFRFLYHRELLALDDARLGMLASFMRRLLFALLACFVLSIAAIPFFAIHYS